MKKVIRIEAVLLCLTLVLGMSFTSYDVYAANTFWSEIMIQEEYELFSEFEVPKRQLTVDGKKVDAKATVTLPDGTTTKANTVKLSEAGKYTVTYAAKVDGKAYAEEEAFLVHNNLCGFTSEDSSAVYGKYEYAKETEGLMVRLAEGDTLTFNKPIDLSSMKSDEWLLEAFATPDSVGHADFNKLCFQFTDVDDPDITLYISAKQTGEDETLPYTYCVAGGNGQTPKGFEVGTGNIYEEGYFGSVSMHSFGLGHSYCSEYCDEQMLKFRVDFKTMGVYSKESMIADLDSAEYFDTVWEGFPSGKAYLTIWADLYSGSSANFCLVKAGNLDLTQTKFIDTEGPVITIHEEYEEVPTAVKGGCYRYIPKATAKDMTSGECDVTTKVFYNYQQPGHTAIDIVDGTFKTEKFGYYGITYEATDIFGNQSCEILWVKAEKTLDAPTIELSEQPATTWTQGEKFTPAKYSYTCHSGTPIFNVYATKDDETYDLNDGFYFEEEGTYHIVYEVKDCAGQIGTTEYDMNVKVGDSPVLGQDITLPAYMMEETEYTLPKVVFNDYRSGKKEKKIATAKIVDANGTTEVKAGEKYKVTVDNNMDTVDIIFVCENASYNAEIPVIKSWGQENGRAKMLYENFFVGSGFNCVQGEQLSFQATEPEGSWQFANTLLAEDFSMELQAVAGSMDYESLVIEMRDSLNEEESLQVELPYVEGVLSVKTGNKTQTLKKGIDLSTAGIIKITVTNGELYVAGAKIKDTKVPKFSSDRLYLTVGFKGAGAKAEYQLLSLNNHTFGSSKTDKIAPKIVIRGDYGGSHSYQDEITLPSAVAGDTLNPNIKFTMTVSFEDEILKDVNGKELKDVDPAKEYTIKAAEYGRYNVVYTAYESFSEKDATMSYMIHISDDVAPTIKFKQQKETEVKLGDAICIPAYTVSDNLTAADKIQVRCYVEDPNGKMILLPKSSNAVTASQEGTYNMIVLALDEKGNVCNESWTVTVAAKE